MGKDSFRGCACHASHVRAETSKHWMRIEESGSFRLQELCRCMASGENPGSFYQEVSTKIPDGCSIDLRINAFLLIWFVVTGFRAFGIGAVVVAILIRLDIISWIVPWIDFDSSRMTVCGGTCERTCGTAF